MKSCSQCEWMRPLQERNNSFNTLLKGLLRFEIQMIEHPFRNPNRIQNHSIWILADAYSTCRPPAQNTCGHMLRLQHRQACFA